MSCAEVSFEYNACRYGALVDLANTSVQGSFFGDDLSSSQHRERSRRSLSCSNLAEATDLESEATKQTRRSRNVYSRLAQPKNTNRKTVTMAEEIQKFHLGTPPRFREKARAQSQGNKELTRAQTPKLQTKQRARHNTAISREEQERLELLLIKQFRIRANPVSKKVLRGPVVAKALPSKLTVMEPFNLTEPKKKEVQEPEKVPAFKALPRPKYLLAKGPTSAEGLKENIQPEKVKGATLPQPFSFEKRDVMLLKKKEAFINKVFEDEKKAREFHARPVPKKMLRSRNASVESLASDVQKMEIDQRSTEFKARPASVLLKKPFVPYHISVETIQQPFSFSTDERLESRHKFAEHLKEKEEKLKEYRRREEEMKQQAEAAVVSKLRKEAVHKAQPVRKFADAKTVAVPKLTVPMSPRFSTRPPRRQADE